MDDRKTMSIEYCTSWGYLKKAASLAEQVLDSNSDKVSELTLTPSSGGVFEVKLGDDLIFSKKATGKFPEPQEILNKVKSG